MTLSALMMCSASWAQAKPAKLTSQQASTHLTHDHGQELYKRWKTLFLKSSPCHDDEVYVRTTGDAAQPNDITVSEAHGYGMLLLATMAPYDKQAQGQFDGMVRLMRRHQVSEQLPLMTWRLDETCTGGAQETSAPDGDLDMAYALLLADARWGSTAQMPYKTLALERIHAVMDHVVQNPNSDQPFLALWEHMKPEDKHFGGTRSSDVMPNHFRAFAQVTSDSRWLKLLNHGYAMFDEIQSCANVGFLPDFIVVDNGHARPAPKDFLEGDNDDSYYYNACRAPWRLAVDAHADARSRKVRSALASSILKACHGRPDRMVDGYTLKGESTGEQRDRLAMLAPVAFLLGTLPETASSKEAWAHYVSHNLAAPQTYYNETLRVLVATGAGQWLPEGTDGSVAH